MLRLVLLVGSDINIMYMCLTFKCLTIRMNELVLMVFVEMPKRQKEGCCISCVR